jgi:hypothetical protein
MISPAALTVKQVLAQAEYLKNRSTTSEYLSYLEDSYSKLKYSKEDPWDVARLIAEHSLENAKIFMKNKLLPSFFTEVNRAWKVLHPLNSKWEMKIDWQLLRLQVFTYLADYYRRYSIIRE